MVVWLLESIIVVTLNSAPDGKFDKLRRVLVSRTALRIKTSYLQRRVGSEVRKFG